MTSSLLSTSATTTNLASNPLINQSSTGSGSSSSSTTTTGSDLTQLNYNFQEFLTLFTTQLKNQDPSNPMDTTQMTNQLAMFSQVEQQAGTNSRLDKLIAAQPSSSLNSAVGYLGHSVQANGNSIVLASGTAQIAYNMPESASAVRIDIKNSSGSLVDTISGDQTTATTGMHQYTWAGTDSSGNTLSDGIYTVTVTATDSAGTTTTVVPVARTTGKVTGIETDSSGNTVLDLSGLQVKTSDVLAIQ